MAKVTPCFENGKGAVVKDLVAGIGFATTEVTVMRPKKIILADYLYFVVHTTRFLLNGSGAMTGAGGLKRVPDSFVKNYVVKLPSLDEQKTLVDFLVSRLGQLRKLQAGTTSAIRLMKERRQALISAAVTGKLEVRV
jgi:type I restriction enzyme S subunit